MRFDYEEFEKVEDLMAYLVTTAPIMKQIIALNSYKGYTFALIPISPLSGDHILMVYASQSLEPGLFEFDLSSQRYKKVTNIERADKNYFVVTVPKKNTLADEAIKALEG